MNAALEALASIPVPAPKYGAHLIFLEIDGFELEITYDLEGRDLPAEREFPAERADVAVVSVKIGDSEVFFDNAQLWDERLHLSELIQESRE